MDYTTMSNEDLELENARLRTFLLTHPIDHKWDHLATGFDGKIPSDEFQARLSYELLQSANAMGNLVAVERDGTTCFEERPPEVHHADR